MGVNNHDSGAALSRNVTGTIALRQLQVRSIENDIVIRPENRFGQAMNKTVKLVVGGFGVYARCHAGTATGIFMQAKHPFSLNIRSDSHSR